MAAQPPSSSLVPPSVNVKVKPESLQRLTDQITELMLNNLDSNDEHMERVCEIQRKCEEEMNAIKLLMTAISSGPDMTDIAENIVRTFDSSMRLTDGIMSKLRHVNEILDQVEEKNLKEKAQGSQLGSFSAAEDSS